MTLTSLHKLVLTLALFAVASIPYIASAQGAVVLSVSPTLFEMTASPSQTWTSNVRVINANTFPMRVYAEPVNFMPAGEFGQGSLVPIFEEENQGETLAEWISVTEEEIIVPPEQTINIPFTITVPDGASPGGHFAAILIGNRPFTDGDSGAQVQTSQVVTSLVFLSVAGDIDESGSIREFRSERRIYESAIADFSIRFENTGNVHVQPQGSIEITNMWGQPRGSIPINTRSQFGNVLPESVRTYQFEWAASGWTFADIGRHTAQLTLAYGDQNRQFVDATAYYWVIPWKLILLFLAFSGLFIGLVVWGVKLYVRRMLQLAGVTPGLQQPQNKRTVSVTAPIEAGILDLRSELEEGQGGRVGTYIAMISKYRLFFLIVGSVLILTILAAWSLYLLATTDYSYEASYRQSDGTTVPVELDQVESEDLTDATAELVVYNYSQNPAAVRQLTAKVSESGIRIKEEFESVSESRAQSVLVYNPAASSSLPLLQSVLPDVLLSAYASEDKNQPPFVLYLGDDVGLSQ